MSHTRCCYDLALPFFMGDIVSGAKQAVSVNGFDAVPAIVECRFSSTVPAAGAVMVCTGMWDGRVIRDGVAESARGFAAIAADINLGIESGFVMEFPEGVGRRFTLFNQTDVGITNVTVSIRKLTTTTVENSSVEGSK